MLPSCPSSQVGLLCTPPKGQIASMELSTGSSALRGLYSGFFLPHHGPEQVCFILEACVWTRVLSHSSGFFWGSSWVRNHFFGPMYVLSYSDKDADISLLERMFLGSHTHLFLTKIPQWTNSCSSARVPLLFNPYNKIGSLPSVPLEPCSFCVSQISLMLLSLAVGSALGQTHRYPSPSLFLQNFCDSWSNFQTLVVGSDPLENLDKVS